MFSQTRPPSRPPNEVPPDGDPASNLCAIGTAPARTEIVKGKPFVGPAGYVLQTCANQAGLVRSDFYLTNVCKEPIDNDAELLYVGKGKNPKIYLTKKGLYWRDKLKEELQSVKANVFIPLGNVAFMALCDKHAISKWRGSIIESTLLPGKKVIPTLHPSSTLHGSFFGRYLIAEDLKRAKIQREFPDIRLPKRNYIINPTWQDATDYIDNFYKTKQTVSWDIEVKSGEVSCISFAPNQMEAMSVPFDHYSLKEEAHLWKSFSRLMEDPDTPKLGMNLIFDTQYILSHNKIQTRGYIDDVMIANHIMMPDFLKGLGFLVSFHCEGEPYYKDEGKTWREADIPDYNQWWTYNAKDSALTFAVWDAIKEDIKEEGYWKYYRDTMDYYDPLNMMNWHGIKVDPDAIQKTRVRTQLEADEKREELNEIVGYNINPRSPTQIKKYFYEEQGITPFTRYDKGTKKSRQTVDDKALARLAKGSETRKSRPEAKLIQEIKSLENNISKYLNITFDKDGRFRCSYDLRGTVTGRFSSSKTITETGANHQNLPLSFREYLIPDTNNIFIEWDKTQAEWVVFAYVCGDANMIKVIESKQDAHAVSGSMISKLPLDYIKLENDYIGHSRDPQEIEIIRQKLDKEHPHLSRSKLKQQYQYPFWPRGYSIRQCGKHSNHGFDYDMSAERFSEEYETDLEDSKRIYRGYHEGYTGIKNLYREIQAQLDKDRTLRTCYGDKKVFMGEWGDDLFKSAYDFIPQGTVSKNNKNGMVRLYRDRSDFMQPLMLLLEGHDSVLGQYPLGDNLNIAKVIFRGITHMHDDLSYRGREFSIRTDVKIGFDWKNMIELDSLDEKEVGDLVKELPSLLEEARVKHGGISRE